MKDGLKSLIEKVESKYGKGIIFDKDTKPISNIETISSSSIALDKALGGGYARGRVIEVYGQESSGKTTQTLHAIANAQAKGGKAMFIDMEHALDMSYAEKLGVNTEDLILVQPEYGEMALDIAENACEIGGLDIIVVDSVAALVPQKELQGDMGDQSMGTHAKLMSQAMRKISPKAHKSNTTVFFINQMREKIGIVFGNPNVTTGGNALKFYASQRIEIKKGAVIKDKEGNAIGNLTKVKVVKNKIARPFQEAEFDIIYGIGIDRVSEIFDLSVKYEIINKKGVWFSYNDVQIGQGKPNCVELLRDNFEMQEELFGLINEKLG